jgi:cytidine deaminase
LPNKSKDDIEKLSNEIFSDDPASKAAVSLKDSQLMAIIEYFRSVHAEMSALMTASRLGISVKGGTLYCTTFPCHECAKHVVAAGIERVVYIEPYPKSRVSELYPDSIAIDNPALASSHVSFEPFVGLAPRQYMSLFELGKIERKTADGRIKQWSAFEANTRMGQPSAAYLEKEQRFLSEFRTKFEALAGLASNPSESGEQQK